MLQHIPDLNDTPRHVEMNVMEGHGESLQTHKLVIPLCITKPQPRSIPDLQLDKLLVADSLAGTDPKCKTAPPPGTQRCIRTQRGGNFITPPPQFNGEVYTLFRD